MKRNLFKHQTEDIQFRADLTRSLFAFVYVVSLGIGIIYLAVQIILTIES